MSIIITLTLYSKFLKEFIYLILEKGEGREKKIERNVDVQGYIDLLPLAHPHLGTWTATQACMCPDWELKRWPFGSQVRTQSTEPHQPGLIFQNIFNLISFMRSNLYKIKVSLNVPLTSFSKNVYSDNHHHNHYIEYFLPPNTPQFFGIK